MEGWGRSLDDELLSNYILAMHEEGLSPSTITVRVSAAKFRARALGCIDPYGPETRAMLSMVRRDGSDRGRGQAKPLTIKQVMHVVETAAAGGTLRGVRDAALISIMFARGLRVGEAAALRVSDFLPQPNGTALLRIRKSNGDQTGKGAILTVPTGPATMVQRWLEMADATEGALFAALQTADYDSPPLITTRNMVSDHIGWLVRKRAEQAGIKGVQGHSLRRSFAQHLSAQGLEIHAIQETG